MSRLDEFIAALGEALRNEFGDKLPGYVDELVDESVSFAERHAGDLEVWARDVAEGTMSPDEATDLIAGLGDLARMHALTELGKSIAEAQRIRNAIFDIVIKTAVDTLI